MQQLSYKENINTCTIANRSAFIPRQQTSNFYYVLYVSSFSLSMSHLSSNEDEEEEEGEEASTTPDLTL